MSVSKTYQIRYNTVSQNDTERWRLIENGNETLVANIIIDGSTYTTKIGWKKSKIINGISLAKVIVRLKIILLT